MHQAQIFAVQAISIHALLAESDIWPFALSPVCKLFLSTLSLRRATAAQAPVETCGEISIHALLAESDMVLDCELQDAYKFLSTLSLRRATSAVWLYRDCVVYFYPRSPCGERPRRDGANGAGSRISIHALLAESDDNYAVKLHGARDFYPRSPCGERRCAGTSGDLRRNFYPRSPCGERHLAFDVGKITGEFLSTLSLRRATQAYFLHWQGMQISIHALLAESDSAHDIFHALNKHFYPRSPCGERLQQIGNLLAGDKISIHALLAESDLFCPPPRYDLKISIHALLAESD